MTVTSTQDPAASPAQQAPKRRCPTSGCFTSLVDHYFLAPDGAELCKQHAGEAWLRFRNQKWREFHPDAPASPSLNKVPGTPTLFSQKRLAGVLVKYQAHHEPVKSIWTPTRLYPYPNLRKRLGLKGSYSHQEGAVVSWGKHQPPVEAGVSQTQGDLS